LNFGYTPAMHRIDRKWTDLAAGYQAIQSLITQLTTEFGRAVWVGHKQLQRRELTEWQLKRRVFLALMVIALLSIIALFLASFYFRDVACVIVYWAVLVLIILITLAVAGRQYIRELVTGKPVQQPVKGLELDLEGRWWQSLSPQELTVEKVGKRREMDFLALLARSLPDLYSTRLLSNSDVLLLGPTGIWILKVEHWSGTVVKQEGTWKGIQTVRDKLGRKRPDEKILGSSPDDQWLQVKNEVVRTIEEKLAERAWTLSLVQGGVVFSHPKVNLDKERIRDITASYGLPKAWIERILRAPLVDGFTLELQLEILDALIGGGDEQSVSARDEAERLYQQAVEELRLSVAKMVK